MEIPDQWTKTLDEIPKYLKQGKTAQILIRAAEESFADHEKKLCCDIQSLTHSLEEAKEDITAYKAKIEEQSEQIKDLKALSKRIRIDGPIIEYMIDAPTTDHHQGMWSVEQMEEALSYFRINGAEDTSQIVVYDDGSIQLDLEDRGFHHSNIMKSDGDTEEIVYMHRNTKVKNIAIATLSLVSVWAIGFISSNLPIF